jgi:hypothetical protein
MGILQSVVNCSGKEELRIDPNDGNSYSMASFLEEYGEDGEDVWEAAAAVGTVDPISATIMMDDSVTEGAIGGDGRALGSDKKKKKKKKKSAGGGGGSAMDDSVDEGHVASKPPKRIYPFADELMLSEYMLKIPADLKDNWSFLVCPEGKRCLVIAKGGQTRAYARNGWRMKQFPSLLPGGCRHARDLHAPRVLNSCPVGI